MQRRKKQAPMGRSHHRHGVKTRNPFATSLAKAQYKKRVVPNKRRDIKPEIEHE